MPKPAINPEFVNRTATQAANQLGHRIPGLVNQAVTNVIANLTEQVVEASDEKLSVMFKKYKPELESSNQREFAEIKELFQRQIEEATRASQSGCASLDAETFKKNVTMKFFSEKASGGSSVDTQAQADDQERDNVSEGDLEENLTVWGRIMRGTKWLFGSFLKSSSD